MQKNGQVQIVNTTTTKTRYTLVNEDSLPRDFLLRIPVTKPEFSPEPTRRVGRLAVYELACEAKGTVEMVFSEVEDKSSQVAVSAITEKVIASWQRSNVEIDPKFLTVMTGMFQRDKDYQAEQKQLKQVFYDRTEDMETG